MILCWLDGWSLLDRDIANNIIHITTNRRSALLGGWVTGWVPAVSCFDGISYSF